MWRYHFDVAIDPINKIIRLFGRFINELRFDIFAEAVVSKFSVLFIAGEFVFKGVSHSKYLKLAINRGNVNIKLLVDNVFVRWWWVEWRDCDNFMAE